MGRLIIICIIILLLIVIKQASSFLLFIHKILDHNTRISVTVWYLFLSNVKHIFIRDGNEPGRPRARPENPGLRALRAETGLMIFHLRVLCALFAGRWVVTIELCIVVTCKCVVYRTNVHGYCKSNESR